MYIGGEWRLAAAGGTSEVHDPASGELVARVASGGPAETEAAIAGALAGFEDGSWSGLRPDQRASALLALGAVVERDREILAELEVLETGKPIREARGDVARALDGIRFYAGSARNIRGETITIDADLHTYTVLEPVGVVAAIIPWNVPLVLCVSKVAPALAAGNTVVAKPAEATPLTALYLARLWVEAGLPPLAFTVLTGPGGEVGKALCEMDMLDMARWAPRPRCAASARCWSWAASRRTSSSPTPISTSPSRAPRARSSTAPARSARPAPDSSSRLRSTRPSSRAWPALPEPCAPATRWTRRRRSAR